MSAADRRIRVDWLFAWSSAACVAFLAYLSGNSLEFPPELWTDLSEAAGIRPPKNEFPALWRICLSYAVENYGISACIAWLKAAGPVSLGLLTVMTCRLFTGLLPDALKEGGPYAGRGRWISRVVVITGSLLFVFSEPVWLAGRTFSPEMAEMFLTQAVLLLSLRADRRSSRWYMILAGAVCGILAAETPAAFVLAVLCWCYLYLRRRLGWVDDSGPLSNKMVFGVTSRRTACVFFIFWICAIALNLTFFTAERGADAGENGAFTAILGYVLHYHDVLVSAIPPAGWIPLFAVVFAPAVVMVSRYRVLTDLTRLLKLPAACFAAFVGTVAFMQSAGFGGFHFWRWQQDAECSRYFLCLCTLVTSAVTASVMSVFALDVYFRNKTRLMREIYWCGADDAPYVRKTLSSVKAVSKAARVCALIVAPAMLSAVIPPRLDGTAREMSAIVNEMACGVSEECANARMLFSDGSIDAAVETVSAEAGRDIKAHSFMSGRDGYDTAVRLRDVTDENQVSLLRKGAAHALRTWVQNAHPCVSNIAVQLGFELWRMVGMSKLQTGGFSACTAFRSREAVENSIARAHALAGRMADLCARPGFRKRGYPELDTMFFSCQWRLARMCRMRADEADRAGESARAVRERELADLLDSLNPEWRKAKKKTEEKFESRAVHLTPREGLRLGLARADFRLAGHYAKLVLADAPGDVQANFALAMEHFIAKNYGEAESHLLKCLASDPGEPTVLNNLAVVRLRMGRLDEAETNAVKALELYPGSREIKTTLRHIRDAKKEAK